MCQELGQLVMPSFCPVFECSCSVNWESKMDNNRSYILYMFTFGLFVPMIVIVVSYLSILRVVKKVIYQRLSP
jgi:hypothetical protein